MPTDRFERKRRVHRDAHAFGRRRTSDVSGLMIAVEDRLAIFMLADLEERRIGRRLDEIAFRVDHVEAQLAALALARHQDAGLEQAVVAAGLS